MEHEYILTSDGELYHFDVSNMSYIELDEGELCHWKYLYKKKVNGKWRYFYEDVKNALSSKDEAQELQVAKNLANSYTNLKRNLQNKILSPELTKMTDKEKEQLYRAYDNAKKNADSAEFRTSLIEDRYKRSKTLSYKISQLKQVGEKWAKDILGYDEKARKNEALDKYNDAYEKLYDAKHTFVTLDTPYRELTTEEYKERVADARAKTESALKKYENATEEYRKTPIGMIESVGDKINDAAFEVEYFFDKLFDRIKDKKKR